MTLHASEMRKLRHNVVKLLVRRSSRSSRVYKKLPVPVLVLWSSLSLPGCHRRRLAWEP